MSLNKIAVLPMLLLFTAYAPSDVPPLPKPCPRPVEVTAGETTAYDRPIVLELFTSQGCSSCPPADLLLQKTKAALPEKVIALSYHVNYWDYIGWKDPFAKPHHAKRQARYNQKFGYRDNYTPELVVNGERHFTGSNAAKLQAAIAEAKDLMAPNKIVVSDLRTETSGLSFGYTVHGPTFGKGLRALVVLRSRETQVRRGENAMRTLINNHIVVNETELSAQESGQGSIVLPDIVKSGEKIALVLLLVDQGQAIDTGTEIDLVAP